MTHIRDHLDEVLLCLRRYIGRHGHRMTQADGTLSDLYVSMAEADALLAGTVSPRAAENAASLDELDKAILARREGRARQPHPDSPIDALASLFSLSELQIRLLLAAAAPVLSVDLARLYAFAWADFAVKQPTVGFLSELVADAPELVVSVAAELSEQATLSRHGLVVRSDSPHWGRPSPLIHQLVTVPERVVAFLVGRPAGLPRSVADAGRFSTAEEARVEVLVADSSARELDAGLARAAVDRRRRPRLLLLGRRGSGRRTLLAGRVAQRGEGLLVVDLARLPADPQPFEEALREACREARLQRAALLLRADDFVDDRARFSLVDRALSRVLDAHDGLVALTAPRPVAQLHHALGELHEVAFPPPAPAQQRVLWQRAIAAAGCSVEAGIADRLVDRFDVPAGTVFAAVEDARARAVSLGHDPTQVALKAEDVIQSVRRRSDHTLSQIAEPFSTSLTWDDVVLPEDIVASLAEIMSHARHRMFVFDDWGFRRKVSYGRGLSCLFSGPPGTGKTMVAAVLAETLGRELYRIDLSRVSSKWVGETEKNLARVFDEAERAQVILLFDEADSLFAKRTEVKSSNDRFANQEINYLLQRMESFDGMTILTTNFEKSIDEAFKRRLKFRLTFPMPDAAQRALLWRSMIPAQANLEADVSFDELGERFELAGGSIKNAVLRAAFYAAEEGAAIRYDHLRKAAVTESEEMGKLINSG